MSEFEYYQDSSQHGNYQYVTLTELINNYMMSLTSDDYNFNIPRYKVNYQFKRGIRELYYDIAREVKSIELDLSSNLQIVLPPDYINYVRISWVNDDNKLIPMTVDSSMSLAKVYLQDNNYNLLFDNQGEVLETQKNNVKTKNSKEYVYPYYGSSFSPNENLSENFNNGSFNIDKNEGVIYFSSDAEFKRIVLEYISDGLYIKNSESEGDIKIHKFAESAVLDFVYYQLCKNRRNVPSNEKFRARKEYFNSRRIAKRRLSGINSQDIRQMFKSDSKWIK